MFTYPLSAAPLDSLGNYENFVIKKEMWVCSSVAFPVDISYDAFNIDYKTVAQGGYGYFMQVKPDSHKDGSVLPDADDIILNPVRGVLNVVGKPAGVYEYVFVSTSDAFCGMGRGEQSVVRVYIAPQLTGFPVLTNVCPGASEDIDFSKFIPPEIKYFIDEMGWTVSYTRDGQAVEMPVKADIFHVGDNVYEYRINDAEGELKNKYSEMQKTVYGCPLDSAQVTHTVRIREGGEYAIPNKSISFCTDILSLVSETKDSILVNLFGYLGSSAPGGKWTVKYPGTDEVSPKYLNVTEDGLADVNHKFLLNVLGKDSIVFQYSYKDCLEKDTFTYLTLNFDKSDFQNTFTTKEHDVCRNLVSGVIELSSIFGFTTPLTSGVWYRKLNDTDFEEMLYGAVDITEMQSGSLYSFRYDVNQAVDSMCLKQGSSTLFNLRIQDIEIANAEAKICKQQFASGVTVDLTRYVPGLNDASRINPSQITWSDNKGNIISRPNSYILKADDETQTHDSSTYKMVFRYDVRSDCGTYTGSLSISAIDSIGVDTLRKIVICYTDDYAKHIDLFQILGVVGANGKFGLLDARTSSEKEINPANISDIESSGIINAYELFKKNLESLGDHESETYTFRYDRNDSCIKDNMTITIVITKDIEIEQKQDSQYEYFPK
jgi:hypothetical protein